MIESNLNYSIFIEGVRSRDDNIKVLLDALKLSSNNVIYDDNKEGPLKSLITGLSKFNNCTHNIILQDDCLLCNNFISICEQMIQTHPDKVIGLFPYDFLDEKVLPLESDSPYYGLKILSGVGIIFPSKYSKDFIEYAKEKGDPWKDDMSLRDFCLDFNIEMLQTIPAIIQHIGDVPVIDKSNPYGIRRSKYFQENPIDIDWKNKNINHLDYYSSQDKGRSGKIARSRRYMESLVNRDRKR